MQEKQIRLVIDKNIILADEKLDITDDIMKALNAKLKSIKLNYFLMVSKIFFKKKSLHLRFISKEKLKKSYN